MDPSRRSNKITKDGGVATAVRRCRDCSSFGKYFARWFAASASIAISSLVCPATPATTVTRARRKGASPDALCLSTTGSLSSSGVACAQPTPQRHTTAAAASRTSRVGRVGSHCRVCFFVIRFGSTAIRRPRGRGKPKKIFPPRPQSKPATPRSSEGGRLFIKNGRVALANSGPVHGPGRYSLPGTDQINVMFGLRDNPCSSAVI